MKRIIILSVLLFVCLALFSQEVKWLDNYDQAIKIAKEKKIPILINFTGSDWCGWCIKLDKEVFSKKDFASYATKNLVMLKLDFPKNIKQSEEMKKANRALADKFKIEGFPTIVLINSDGKEINRTGYQEGGEKKYIEHLNSLLKKK
jgi:protein disulfide-isomerase